MKTKVFVAKSIPLEVKEYLGQYCDYRIWDSEEAVPRELLMEEVRDIDGLLATSSDKIDEELLRKAPRLKVVSNIAVGYNNFNLEAMKARKVIGTNTPFVLDETVADLVFGLILSSARRICELDRYVKEGKWLKRIDESLFGLDVHHTTLGIIGMGRIGEKIAQRAKLGFSMDVLYYNRTRKSEVENSLGIEYSEMDELLKKADFVVLMTPLTPQTKKMIGERELNLMKRTAIFINASRGETVDEGALLQALQEKKILAAALDVYEQEPVDTQSPLLQLSNVVMMPHIGSATAKTRFDMAMRGARNLVLALSGEVPPNLVEELK